MFFCFHHLYRVYDNLIRYIQLTDADGDLTRGMSHRQRFQTDHLKQSLITDDNLIQDGFLQVAKVQDVWKDENSIKDDKGNAVSGIGLPTISYTSPLTRCLVTNSVTFTPFLGADGFKTVVVEVSPLVCYSFTQFPCPTI